MTLLCTYNSACTNVEFEILHARKSVHTNIKFVEPCIIDKCNNNAHHRKIQIKTISVKISKCFDFDVENNNTDPI